MPLARALGELLSGVQPVAPRAVDPATAEGFVLADPLAAPGPIPATRTALRGGWAVVASETAGASPYSPTRLTCADRVGVGGALQRGRDAVLAEDAVAIGADGAAEASESVAPGTWTRGAGEDAGVAHVLRAAGERLSALDAAIAVAIGVATVAVRRPRLRLIGLGHEQPGLDACLGLCASLARRWGCEVDGPENLPSLAHDALGAGDADLAVIVAPAGPDVAATLEAVGARIVAGSLALRPGEATVLARLGERPVIAVPATLADAVGACLAILRPVLDHLCAAAPPVAARRPLTRKIVSTIGLAEIALMRSLPDGLEPVATSDLTLAALAAADHYLCLPPGSEGLPAGSPVGADRL